MSASPDEEAAEKFDFLNVRVAERIQHTSEDIKSVAGKKKI